MISHINQMRLFLNHLGLVYKDTETEILQSRIDYLQFDRGFIPEHAVFIVNLMPSKTSCIEADSEAIFQFYSFDLSCSRNQRNQTKDADHCWLLGDHLSSAALTLRSNWKSMSLEYAYIDFLSPEKRIIWDDTFVDKLHKLTIGDAAGLELFSEGLPEKELKGLVTKWESVFHKFLNAKSH